SGIVFANLITPIPDGSEVWCADCTAGSSPCTGSGTGSVAQRRGGVWSCAATSPGGSDTQVQFNDAGAFGGDANLRWRKNTQNLAIGNPASVLGNFHIQRDSAVTSGDAVTIFDLYENTVASGAQSLIRRARGT